MESTDTVEKVGHRGPTKIARLPVKGRLRRLMGSPSIGVVVQWCRAFRADRVAQISRSVPTAQRNVIDLKESTFFNIG